MSLCKCLRNFYNSNDWEDFFKYVLAFKKILFQIFAKAFEDLIVIVFLMQYAKKKTFPVLFAKRKMHLVSSEPSGIPADFKLEH